MLSAICFRQFSQKSIYKIRISNINLINLILLLLLLTKSATGNNKELINFQTNQPLINKFIPLSSINQYIPVKKSDMGLNEFMLALNEANRLRYGKRFVSLNNYEDIPNNDDFTSYNPVLSNRWPAVKRMESFSQVGNLPALIDSLNGAERLRFGRK